MFNRRPALVKSPRKMLYAFLFYILWKLTNIIDHSNNRHLRAFIFYTVVWRVLWACRGNLSCEISHATYALTGHELGCFRLFSPQWWALERLPDTLENLTICTACEALKIVSIVYDIYLYLEDCSWNNFEIFVLLIQCNDISMHSALSLFWKIFEDWMLYENFRDSFHRKDRTVNQIFFRRNCPMCLGIDVFLFGSERMLFS